MTQLEQAEALRLCRSIEAKIDRFDETIEEILFTLDRIESNTLAFERWLDKNT